MKSKPMQPPHAAKAATRSKPATAKAGLVAAAACRPSVPACRSDVEQARDWLLENANGTHVRHVLERGLEYAEAVERAGLSLEMIEGDDLYQFLSDPRAAAARTKALHEPTL